jgi:pyruvate formate lyase activating enzyme
MSNEPATSSPVPLEAKSPYELRTNLSKNIPDNVIKQSLDSGDIGFLHSFTTGSTVDGPGVRVVVWTAGCQFRCLYCHNPDTWSLSNGMPVPLERAVEQLKKYRTGLQRMSGGLTISGGEPLMQDRFVTRFFAAAKQMGVHTTLDTNGFLGDRLSDDELRGIDLVMLDIKLWNPERHRELTAKDLAPTLTFARRLSALKRPMWLRYVLVPGWTDGEEDVANLAKFAGSLGNVERVDVLPFHQMGRYKWKQLGLDYTLTDTQPPPRELVERVVAQFRSEGLTAY